MTQQLLLGQTVQFTHDPFFGNPEDAAQINTRGGVLIEDGRIVAVGNGDDLRRTHPQARVTDHRDGLITAGFVDAHMHYPQTAMIASWGKRLIDWLNTYTFPEEMRFADRAYADDIAGRTLDLALQNGPFRQQMTGEIPLGDYPLVWVASRGLGLRGITNPTIEHIAQHPILTHSRDTRLYTETAAHFGARKDLDVRLVPSSNLAACLYMTLNGMGVATLPAAMISKELNEGDLIQIQYQWQPDDLEFFARFDADRAPSFVAQAAKIAKNMAEIHNAGG